MSSKMEKFYANLPALLQNFAVSIQGWVYTKKRYGKTFPFYLDKLMRCQWFSAEQFRQLQTSELQRVLCDAYEHIPHHRKSLKDFAGKLDSINLKSIKDLPFMEKSMLRSNVNDFVNQDSLKGGYEEGHTSGTSGTPFIWPSDYESGRYNLAFRERQYYWAGISHHNKSARFSGRDLLGKYDGPPYWRHNVAENQMLFSTYHITSETLPLYYQVLEKEKLQFLDGYPSAIFTLAKWINQNNKSRNWRPWAVITTAETLLDFQREEIEKAFGCKVYNFYSSSEGAPFVTQCEAGRMHLNPESGIIEFLLPDGSQASPGQEAEMVVTNFFKRSLPLIRYRIGDVGTLSEEKFCPCGRQMPIIENIGGRESEALYSTERGRVGSAGLSTALYKVPHRLQQSQIEQTGKDAFVFRYVPLGLSLNEQERGIICNALHTRLGNKIDLSLAEVDSIPKGANGKIRLIIGIGDNKETGIN